MILIVGGTGALGSSLARLLLEAGRPVRVMARDPQKAAGLAVGGAEVVRGDLLDRESLERACQGAEAVVAAAHSMLGRGASASVHVDGRGHRDLIAAAGSAGVGHFVYTSAYAAGAMAREIPFFRIKAEVEEHLRQSGLHYTILRPTAFMETHAHMLIGEPILKTGKVAIFGRGERPRNFVAAGDVARIAAQVLFDGSAFGEGIDIGGPENLTTMEVVRTYERAAGRPAKVRHVPIGVLRVVSKAIRPLHPGVSQIIAAGILAETTDQSFDPAGLEERFGFELTRLEEFAARRAGHTAAAR